MSCRRGSLPKSTLGKARYDLREEPACGVAAIRERWPPDDRQQRLGADGAAAGDWTEELGVSGESGRWSTCGGPVHNPLRERSVIVWSHGPMFRDVLLRLAAGGTDLESPAAGPVGPRATPEHVLKTPPRRVAGEGRGGRRKSCAQQRSRVFLAIGLSFRTTPARRSQATLAMSRATQCRRPQPNPEDGRPVRAYIVLRGQAEQA